MLKQDIFSDILEEIRDSKKSFRWPNHIVAQAAIVNSSAGALLRESLTWKYGNSNKQSEDEQQLKEYAILTAAMAIRFLQNLENEPISKRNNDTETANIGVHSSQDGTDNTDEERHHPGETVRTEDDI